MSKLRCDISVSADGFVAGPNQSDENPLGEGGEGLHDWVISLAAWREAHGLQGGEVNESARIVDESREKRGLLLQNRNELDPVLRRDIRGLQPRDGGRDRGQRRAQIMGDRMQDGGLRDVCAPRRLDLGHALVYAGAFDGHVQDARQRLGHALELLAAPPVAVGLAVEHRGPPVGPQAPSWIGGEEAVFAVELGDERRLASLLLNLGLSAANESRWDDAAKHYTEAEVRFRSVGHVVGGALVANNRAELLTDQGRYDEARPLLEESP